MERETQRLLPRVWEQCLLANLDRPFLIKKDILKQKRIAGSERVKRKLEFTEVKKSES